MNYGIRIVGEKRKLPRPRSKQAVLLVHQMTQPQHAQADAQRVIEVAARDVRARACRLETREELPDLGFELELGERALRVRDEDDREQRHWHHRHDASDRLHELAAEARNRGATLLAR